MALQEAQCKPSQLADDLIRTKEMLRSHDKSPVLECKESVLTRDAPDGGEVTPIEGDVVKSLKSHENSAECHAEQAQMDNSQTSPSSSSSRGVLLSCTTKQSVPAAPHKRKLHFVVDDDGGGDGDRTSYSSSSGSSFDETDKVVDDKRKTLGGQDEPSGGNHSNQSHVQCRDELTLDFKSKLDPASSPKPNSSVTNEPSEVTDASGVSATGSLSSCQRGKGISGVIKDVPVIQNQEICSSGNITLKSGSEIDRHTPNRVHNDGAMLNGHHDSGDGCETALVRLKGSQGKGRVPQRIKVTVTVDENN